MTALRVIPRFTASLFARRRRGSEISIVVFIWVTHIIAMGNTVDSHWGTGRSERSQPRPGRRIWGPLADDEAAAIRKRLPTRSWLSGAGGKVNREESGLFPTAKAETWSLPSPLP